MPLYGHEMNDDISPLEAGLGFAVKMKKDDFIGKGPMEEAGDPAVVRVGLKVTGRGIVREHQDVYNMDGELIGQSTSGTKCPCFDKPIAMARVPREYAAIGTKMNVDVRGRMVEVEVIPLPFYKRT